MGILDELRAKAEAQRTADQLEQERHEQLALRFKEEVRPRFKALYNYLRELTEHLNYLKSEITANYRLPGSKDLFRFIQQDYVLTANSSDNITHFKLRCQAIGRNPIYLHLNAEQNPDKFISDLLKFDLHGSKPMMGNNVHKGTSVVAVDPLIPISFSFTLNPDDAVISVLAKNFPELGSIKRSFDASQLNDHWMEDIGDMVVRKKDILTPLAISKEEHARIKEEIRRRSLELGH